MTDFPTAMDSLALERGADKAVFVAADMLDQQVSPP